MYHDKLLFTAFFLYLVSTFCHRHQILASPSEILQYTTIHTRISSSSQVLYRMSDKRPSDTQNTDNTGTKSWDRAEYARKGEEDEAKRKEEGKARYEAKLLGKKWHAPVDYSSLDTTTSRKERLDVASMVGKTTIVSSTNAVGKRGRGAGFYCSDCDLTFKDNLQLVEHLNSKQHLIATGQSGEVTRATVEDVRERLRMLAHQKRAREEEERMVWNLDLGERLKEREEQISKEREEKRRKRNEKRRKGGDEVKQEDSWEGRLGIIA